MRKLGCWGFSTRRLGKLGPLGPRDLSGPWDLRVRKALLARPAPRAHKVNKVLPGPPVQQVPLGRLVQRGRQARKDLPDLPVKLPEEQRF
jgi:hypothetical protein